MEDLIMLDIIILGIVQGIAEFLPISSSAHLILVREIFKIGFDVVGSIDLTFDLALHFGTLLAIIIYFFKDLWNLLKDGVTKGIKTANGKIFWYLILATIPAGLIGFLFEDFFDSFFRQKLIIIAIALIGMGLIIYFVDKNSKSNKTIKELTWKDALMIGCAQVFALIPGFSRSGTTITAGRLLKLNREEAAKFSFYLSVPIIAGASLITLVKSDTFNIIISNLGIFVLGITISFIVGILCISFLLKYIKKHNFEIFMWYRLIIGVFIILTLIIK